MPGPGVSVAGETSLYVDPAGIPSGSDVDRLGTALAQGRHGNLYELMAHTAAYSGLRHGEEYALTIGQIDAACRVIEVNRKVIEVGGKQYVEPPKGCKRRKTIYAVRLPSRGQDQRPGRGSQERDGPRPQPGRADVPVPARQAVAVLQFRPAVSWHPLT